MQQVQDLVEESNALAECLHSVPADLLDRPTQFKAWTPNDILRHLQVWNEMACLQVTDSDELLSNLKQLSGTPTLRAFEESVTSATDDRLTMWSKSVNRIEQIYEDVEPKQRLKWIGPDMSARSSITARQMETWAHGQAIFDLSGRDRPESDRIKNIVVLGINTYGYCLKIRGVEVPAISPFVELTSPSGVVWTFGDERSEDRVKGPAVEFCQVLTQTRNVADTRIEAIGPNALFWMKYGQCFAGPAHDPPPPGSRYKISA